MKKFTIALAGLLVSLSATLASAQEKGSSDPSGTWRWDLEMNGNTINNVLKLQADKDGKVTGTLAARDMTLDVKDGKFKDGQLTFQIVAELQQTVKIDFDGKLDGDKLLGDITFNANGEKRETTWDAKRSVDASDLVGAWDLKIETPDGQTLKPVLNVSQNGKDLTAKYEYDGKQIEAKELQIKDNHVLFEIDMDFNGSPLHVEFKGRPYGSKLTGSLEYSVNGDSGTLEFSGARQTAKKS